MVGNPASVLHGLTYLCCSSTHPFGDHLRHQLADAMIAATLSRTAT